MWVRFQSEMFEPTSVTSDTRVKMARASNCVSAPLLVRTERLSANRLRHLFTLQPALGFEEQVTVWNRRGPRRLTLHGFEPGVHLIGTEWVSLPPDGKCHFQRLKTFFEGFEGEKHWRVRLDIARSLPLDVGFVCAGEPRHKRKQALPLSIARDIVQMHRQTADGPREALWHILHPTDRPVLKTSGNDRCFIDAGSAVFAGEPVGAVSELPVKDVIETVHGGDPYAAPQEDRDRRVVHLSIRVARISYMRR